MLLSGGCGARVSYHPLLRGGLVCISLVRLGSPGGNVVAGMLRSAYLKHAYILRGWIWGKVLLHDCVSFAWVILPLCPHCPHRLAKPSGGGWNETWISWFGVRQSPVLFTPPKKKKKKKVVFPEGRKAPVISINRSTSSPVPESRLLSWAWLLVWVWMSQSPQAAPWSRACL